MTAAVTAATSAATAPAAAAKATNPLLALSNNFNDFLTLLTTQLKNQDPTTPMDTNTFTTELVQFTSVEQQISTNTNLTQLIQATQGSEVIQATDVVGKSLTVASTNIALQNGSGALSYNTTTAEPVSIKITNAAGATVNTLTGTSTAGTNSWKWDGTDSTGATLPDGSYGVAITGTNAAGTAAAVPFSVIGTATGVTNTNGVVAIQLGAVSVPFSSVQSVGN